MKKFQRQFGTREVQIKYLNLVRKKGQQNFLLNGFSSRKNENSCKNKMENSQNIQKMDNYIQKNIYISKLKFQGVTIFHHHPDVILLYAIRKDPGGCKHHQVWSAQKNHQVWSSVQFNEIHISSKSKDDGVVLSPDSVF